MPFARTPRTVGGIVARCRSQFAVQVYKYDIDIHDIIRAPNVVDTIRYVDLGVVRCTARTGTRRVFLAGTRRVWRGSKETQERSSSTATESTTNTSRNRRLRLPTRKCGSIGVPGLTL